MNVRNKVGAVTLALGLLGTAVVGQAAVHEFEITIAPPQERVETVPPPREGYIYERGHYVYDGQRYVWTEGQFIRKREGHVYTPYALERRGEKWHFRAGHWDDDG